MRQLLFRSGEIELAENDPVKLAKEHGINSHFYADLEQLIELLNEGIKNGPQMGLLNQGRELPCYFIKIEEFYTPICYDPPAGRLILFAHDSNSNEWLLLGANWFAGVADMMLPSHIFIDELEMLVNVVRTISTEAKVRIFSAVDILATTRSDHLATRMEPKPL
jgi:hypothetical protein